MFLITFIKKKEDMNAITSYKTSKLLIVPILYYALIWAHEDYRKCKATGRCHTKAVSGWETWWGQNCSVSRAFRKTEVSGKSANYKLTSLQLGIQCSGQQNIASTYLKNNAL